MPAGRVGGKKSKRRDERPARKRYWMKRTLEKRKVRNIVRNQGRPEAEATRLWNQWRVGRVPDGFLRRGAA